MRWVTTRYRIVDGQIELQRGLLNKQTTTARLDKVRTVDLTAKLHHRLLGLAKVEISTGGGQRDRLVLDSLLVDEGRRLRAELLHRANPEITGLPAPTGAPVDVGELGPDLDVAPVADEEVLLRLDPAWIRYAPLTTTGLATAAAALGFLTPGLHPLRRRRASVLVERARGLRELAWWIDVVLVLVLVCGLAVVCLRPDLLGLPAHPQPPRQPAHPPRAADDPRDEHRPRAGARHPDRRAARAAAGRRPPPQGRDDRAAARAGRLRLALPARAGRDRHGPRPPDPPRRAGRLRSAASATGRRLGAGASPGPSCRCSWSSPSSSSAGSSGAGPPPCSASRPCSSSPRSRSGSTAIARSGMPSPQRTSSRGTARSTGSASCSTARASSGGRSSSRSSSAAPGSRHSSPRPRPAASTTTSSTCRSTQAYAVLAEVSPDLVAEFA